jgi:hypothetical protein
MPHDEVFRWWQFYTSEATNLNQTSFISFHLFQVHADPNTIGYRMSQHTGKQTFQILGTSQKTC